uniref:Major facilitator superfamily (MFS) profile domain-containing protein n=1 Tax=Phaeomonas parva TaxID=124430 RepID=A0A7S1XR46_9STRA
MAARSKAASQKLTAAKQVDVSALAKRGGGAVATAPASPPIAGVLSVVGGVLVHLTLGTIYCFGNFISYMPKSMYFFDGEMHEGNPHALLVLPITMLFQCFGLPLGAILQKRMSPSKVALLGAWIMAAGVYLSSYATDLTTFMIGYSVLFGIGIGMAYTSAWVEGWKWFPRRRGLVSGSVLTGFGAGGFFFNKIGTSLVNPDNMQTIDGVFPDAVYSRWPLMLRSLAIIYAVLAAVGAFLIRTPPKGYAVEAAPGAADAPAVKSLTVKEAVATKQFWMIWACIFMSVCGCLNVSSNYKYLGSAYEHLNDDAFLSLAGGLSALANAAGRLFWGSQADAHGFKKPVMALTALQALLYPLYKVSTHSRKTYMLATMLVFFCLGGNFSIFPGVMPKIFGPENGAAIYSVIYSAFGSTAVASFFLAKELIAKFGWQMSFNALGGMSLVAMLIGGAFQPIAL